MAKGFKTGGREKGTRNKSRESLHSILDQRTDMTNVVDSLYRLATGVFLGSTSPVPFTNGKMVTVKSGKTEKQVYVYMEKPDRAAAEFLVEQRFGKAPVAVTVAGDPDNPVAPPAIVVPMFDMGMFEAKKK